VAQKRREIALLRSMGYQASQIMELFLLQGLAVGLAGSTLGLVIGYAITEVVFKQFQKMGTMKMVAEIDPNLYLQGLILAIGSALLASYIPARSASRMNPIDIIREE
jgi:lipoprotein-releasing system permease protein